MTTLHAGPSEVGTHAQHHPAKRESKFRKSYTRFILRRSDPETGRRKSGTVRRSDSRRCRGWLGWRLRTREALTVLEGLWNILELQQFTGQLS